MAIVVTITADTPAQLAPMWAGLGGHTATVNLDADHMWIDVDMRHTDEDGAEPFTDTEQGPAEDLVDQLAPIPTDDEPEDQVDDIAEQEPEPAAEVVAIDRKARQQHPTGTTLAAQILDLFNSEPATEFTPSDVLDHLDATGATYGGISGAIATLVRNGKIQRVGRGKYKAGAAS